MPTGSLTFLDGVNSIGTGTLSGATASFSTSGLIVGTHAISVSYNGDANFNASTSSAITQTVNSARGATTTTLSNSPNPSLSGQAVTFTATVAATSGSDTPTGTVTYTDAGATIGSSSLTGGVAIFTSSSLSVGVHLITASYGGGSNFLGSDSTAVAQTVNQNSTIISITSSPNPSATGQPVAFTITVTPQAPGGGIVTGTITLRLPKATLDTVSLDRTGHATFTISNLPSGSNTITATYSGDGNFLTSLASVVQTVGAKAASTTTLQISQNPAVFGTALTFTATVTGAGNTPTGTVSVIDAKITLAAITLDASGVATFATSSLSIGTHNIHAQYNGSGQYNTSGSNVVSQTISASTSTTVVANQSAFRPANPISPVLLALTPSVLPTTTMPHADEGVEPLALSPSASVHFADRAVTDWLADQNPRSTDTFDTWDVATVDRVFSSILNSFPPAVRSPA
jgi:hypothetical protein